MILEKLLHIGMFISSLLLNTLSFGQDNSMKKKADSSHYEIYKDRLILHTSLGYSTAPFSLNYEFSPSVDKLNYKANMNPVLGVGFAYKWAALNIRFRLPGYIRNVREFGRTNYLDLGFKFNIKRLLFSISTHFYNGFTLADASTISPEITPEGVNNQIRNDLSTASFSLKTWYFKNKKYNLKASEGIRGLYKGESYSPYLKGALNIFGVNGDSSLAPFTFLDTSKTIIQTEGMSAIDLSFLPGFAYVNNIDGWQFGFWTGLGIAAQLKFLNHPEQAKVRLGLRPRLDINLFGGYNIEDWFVLLHANFDNRSIAFDGLSFRQQYYTVSLSLGHRFGN